MKIKNATIKFFKSNVFYDLAGKFLLMLTLVYSFLFCLETILPGLVIDIFNLNLLLFVIVINLVTVFATGGDRGKFNKLNGIKKGTLLLVVGFFAFVMLSSFYKVSFLEAFVYVLFVIFLGKLFFDNLVEGN